MTGSPSSEFGAPRPAMRLLRLLVLAGLALFVIRTALLALQSPWQVDDFPEALAIKVELLPVVFPLHMITGGLALLLVPLTFLLRRRPRWHRPAGRFTAGIVLLAGLSAFPVALIAPVTPVSAWGFAAQGATWLVLLTMGLRQIRARRPRQHRAFMLMMAAVTTGAVFFRIYLALWAIWGDMQHYEAFYAADAWLAWTLPLAAMAFFLKRTGGFRGDPR